MIDIEYSHCVELGCTLEQNALLKSDEYAKG